MRIETEQQITPEVALKLREQSGLTQRKFWESVGSTQASGHWFEHGKRLGIPKPLRILIFLRYIIGLELDFDTPESAQLAVAAGREVAAKIAAQRADTTAKEAAQRAKALAREAKNLAA